VVLHVFPEMKLYFVYHRPISSVPFNSVFKLTNTFGFEYTVLLLVVCIIQFMLIAELLISLN